MAPLGPALPQLIGRRLLHGALVLWMVSVLVFALFFLAPGDVALRMAGHQATPEMVGLIRARLGLDQPVLGQYGTFVWHILHGDLGYDYYNQVPVSSIIADAWPKTLSVVLGAAALWLGLGVLIGTAAAIHVGSVADRVLTGVALIFYSMPEFLLGLVLLYFAYYRLSRAGLPLFPAGGYVPLTEEPLEWVRFLLLPWITLALFHAAAYSRLIRSSLLDVLGEDYVRTARSKGLSDRRVVLRHGLRSAITPVLTQFGIDLGALLGGAVVVEQVFGINGLGREAINALENQNLPVIMGIVLFGTVVVVVSNLAVDTMYAVLDPRVRLH